MDASGSMEGHGPIPADVTLYVVAHSCFGSCPAPSDGHRR